MAYQTYITEALVCGSRVHHTSDRSYLLFSREAGMLYASAKSVREERSKQRFALQEFSLIRATLIHGKAGWRIAGVEPLLNFYTIAQSREERAFIRNIIMLLRRVVRGETPHQEMYDRLIASLKNHAGEAFTDAEYILSLRILHTLGYVSPEEPFVQLLAETGENNEQHPLTDTEREKCAKIINHALTESQL